MAGRFVQVDTTDPDTHTVSDVSAVLESGGTVVYPSDTVYGILADSSNHKAVERVAELKGYLGLRPFIVLVRGVERALELTSQKSLEPLMNRYWPGPFTLVLKAAETVPPWLVSREGTVALRIPSDKLSDRLLRETGVDLVSTSANQKGDPFPLSIQAIPDLILKGVSVVLDGGLLQNRKPSRIIDITGERPVEIRS